MNKEIETNNSAFVFVPQVIVKYGNDADIAYKIRERLAEKNRDKFVILTEDLSPLEIKALIGNFDYFIGTRMHSNIFAISMKTPTIAIAYEKKTNGIMHTVGLDDYVIEMNSISLDILEEKARIQKENASEIHNKLDKKIEDIRKEIIINMEKVLNEE